MKAVKGALGVKLRGATAVVSLVLALSTGAAGAATLPLVVGGRSSGARVACRTAAELGAVAVVALAFPLYPPGRPGVSRAGELGTGVPTLVVNGERDPFGLLHLAIGPRQAHPLV